MTQAASFWREVRQTSRLAAPLILGQLAAISINFVDTVMAGHFDALALAGVAIGGAVWSAAMLFTIGVLMAIPPHLAERVGAGRVGECGAFLQQAGYVAAGLALLFVLTLVNAEPLLWLARVDPQILPIAMGYLRAIAWGVPALCGFLVLRMASEGLGLTRPVMYFGLLGLAINIPANYVLIFGQLGFPSMGAVGCGYASSLTQWLQLLAFLLYVRRREVYRTTKLFRSFALPRWPQIRQLLRVGLPIGGSVFVEGSLFASAALLLGSLGPTIAAAHQAAINFSGLAFMIPLGLGMAMTVRISNARGRQDPAGVRLAARVGFSMVLCTQLLSLGFMLLFPQLVAGLYSNDQEVQSMVIKLLFLAAIFQLPDGFQAAGASALRGLEDTRIPMLFTIVAYWLIGMPLGYYLGLEAGYGAEGMWVGLIAGLTVAAVLMYIRFQRLSSTGYRA